VRRVLQPPEDGHETPALDSRQTLDAELRRGTPYGIHDDSGGSLRCDSGDHGDVVDRPPAERRGARLHRVVGLATQHGVDDKGLQTGVPPAARLRGAGVDLSCPEGDLS
jgi:hypothetical protein